MNNKVGSRTDMSIIGKRFGMLTVLDLDHITSNSYTLWRCRCENCGKEVVLRRDVLKTGIHTRCEKGEGIKRAGSILTTTKPFSSILKDTITAAKELGYPKECVRDLRTTKSEDEIEKIMRKARHGGYGKDGQS